jgi:hypothetical protein
MSRIPLALALSAALALTALPAAAADGECRLIRGADTETTTDDVEVCQQDSWIAESDNKVGNVATTPTWDQTAPASSVASGAGGGYLGAAVLSQRTERHNPQNDTTFAGTFTGNLDTITWSLYLFTTARQINPDQAVALKLTIDGTVVFLTGDEANRTPLRSGGNAVQVTDFTFTNLHAAMERKGLTLGDDVEHTIELSIAQWFSVNDNAVYVYDTTEAPSSVVFNGPALGASIKL